MKTTINQTNNDVVIIISGRLDTTNSQDFQNEITPLMSKNGLNITVDCNELEYTSSSGLRQFLALQKSTSANNGKLTIKNLRPEIKEIFDLTGFSAIFSIE